MTGLKTGVTYTLHEEVAPDGYTIAADTEFTIDEHGKVTSTGTITKDGVMLIEDAITSVKVSKVDADAGAELEGAVIQIIDEDGNVVAEWTSGTEPYEVKGLITGKTYTLHEVTAPDGYEVTSDTTFVIDETGKVTSTGNTTTDADGNTVMLVEDSAKQTKATVIKVWEDGENQDGVRPMSLTVTLTQTVGGTTSEYATVTLNAGNAWTATEEKLPVMVNGVEATYSWSEGALTLGYELKSTETETDEEGAIITTLTNEKEVEKTEISVKKVWDDRDDAAGKRPESIDVTLYADGETVETVALNAGNGWSYTWSELDKNRNESGLTGEQHEIAYTVNEGEIPEGYELEISGDAESGFVLTNTYTKTGKLVITKAFLFEEVEEEPEEEPEEKPEQELIDIPVTKIWDDNDNQDGIRPGSVTVHLYAGGTQVASASLSEGSGWSAVFSGLPRYAEGTTNEIVYSISEDAVPGYVSEVSGFSVTNRHVPEETSATVIKVWDDDNNAAGKRPESLYARLSDGTVVMLSDANGWTATVTGLPKMADGVEIVYTWKEQEAIGYVQSGVTVAGNTTTFTNKLWQRPELADEVEKPKVPGDTYFVFEEYETPLGVEVMINHVGDCFD